MKGIKGMGAEGDPSYGIQGGGKQHGMGSVRTELECQRLTLSSSLEEMNRQAFVSTGSLILLPCQ